MSPEAVGEPLEDLAAKRLGGIVLAASDEFFAPKERLLEPAAAVYEAGRYTDRGKWMDGWETRRLRGPGNDWALVRLGLPGVVRTVVVDTAHFRGNHPATSFASARNLLLPGDAADMGDGWETRRRRGPGHDWAVVRLAAEGTIERVEVGTTHYKGNYPDRCSVEACGDVAAEPGDPGEDPEGGWWTVVPPSRLGPHRQHVFAAPAGGGRPATHVRLAIYPDGGVSRLRVLGQVSDRGWQRWGLHWLNALPAEQAEAELLACCSAPEWASRVAAVRPFADAAALAASADEVWETLGPDDWLEAFAAHPRIGERSPGASWSSVEQAGVGGADPGVLAALVEGNLAYERRFGHVFLISASGRKAEELLAALRQRLDNDPETELRVAASEQRKITRLRLDRLLRP